MGEINIGKLILIRVLRQWQLQVQSLLILTKILGRSYSPTGQYGRSSMEVLILAFSGWANRREELSGKRHLKPKGTL